MNESINSPLFNDNRIYDYSEFPKEYRKEYSLILDYIPDNSKVIDLGCGNGSLLMLLKEKSCSVKGIEISDSGIEICKAKGLDVIKHSIDTPPLPFKDNEFDFSVCNVTIQMVLYPEKLLNEMKRISKNIIISFPNFAFYRNRIELMFKGTMPKAMLFGYKWYSTGHIHQLSIKDFKQLIKDSKGLDITKMSFLPTGNFIKDFLIYLSPNLFLILPVFLITKNEL